MDSTTQGHLYGRYREYFKDMTPAEAKECMTDLWKGYKVLVAELTDNLTGMSVAVEELERMYTAYSALVDHTAHCNAEAETIAKKLKDC